MLQIFVRRLSIPKATAYAQRWLACESISFDSSGKAAVVFSIPRPFPRKSNPLDSKGVLDVGGLHDGNGKVYKSLLR